MIYTKVNKEATKVHRAHSKCIAFAKEAAAAFELAAVGLAVLVTVDEGFDEGVPEAVVFNCSNGTITASKTCMRPL